MAISDAKWKYSRIVFDLAAAYKESDGKVSLDDAVVMAATPAAMLDFAKCDDSELNRIMQEMKRFLKSNSRFRTFTKAAISEGLRLEWLPGLEDDDKLRLLSDIKFITDVTEDGFIEVNPTMLQTLTASEHPDCERYGTEPYSPKPARRSAGPKRPKIALTMVERDSNLAAKLKPYIDWYKKNWELLQRLEDYKWSALEKFQKNFDIEAEDFFAMLSRSYDRDFNLLATGSFYNPLGGILKLAKYTPEGMREAFSALYNDEVNLAHRVDTFLETFSNLYNRLADEGIIKPGGYDKQSERAVSVYLAFHNPSQYFIFKPSLWWDFVSQTDVTYPSLTYFESKLSGYQLICEQIREVLMQDSELLTLLGRYQPNDPSDGHLLTQDFLYAIGVHFVDFNSQPRYFIEQEQK
ncbi:MAG: hypothetical protein NC311_18525 [Muribaculaceae bacterium]|nr:hypothetical protein [Muribaculaceae bacterium]